MSLLISSMLSCISFFSQLQLRGGAPDTSTTLIALPSPVRSSVLTMCFPDEIANYRGIDGLCRMVIMMRSYFGWLLVSPSQILYLVIFMCLL